MMYDFNEEEKEILEAFEHGKLKSVPNKDEEIKKHRAYARATFERNKQLRIRLSSRDMDALQIRARSEGIPYHTLAASVLHKFLNGELVQKEM